MSINSKEDGASAIETENLCETTILVEKCSFTWRIANFSYSGGELGYCLRSPAFGSKVDGRCKWRITFFPSGDEELDKISLYLRLLSGPKKVVAFFTFYVRDSHDSEIFKWDAGETLFSDNKQWGCGDVLSSKELKKKISANDILTIHVDITASVGMLTVFNDVATAGTSSDVSEQVPCSVGSTKRLADDLAGAFVNHRFTDLVINVKGKKILAHQFVLASRSPVFAAALEHDTAEKASKCFDIEDFDYETVNALIHFLYTGRVLEFQMPLTMTLLKAADKYAVDDLKELCANHMLSKLNKSNVLQALLLADMHSASRLKESALTYICENLHNLTDSKIYEPLLEQRPCLFVEILTKLAKR